MGLVRGCCVALPVVVVLLAPGRGAAGELPAFSVTKSSNANAVVYSLRVDDDCRPLGSAPLAASWRMADGSAQPLLAIERPIYGIARQLVGADGTVDAVVRALPGHALAISAEPWAGGCRVRAVVAIGGRPAVLRDVHVVMRGVFRVDRLLLAGEALDDGSDVREAIAP